LPTVGYYDIALFDTKTILFLVKIDERLHQVYFDFLEIMKHQKEKVMNVTPKIFSMFVKTIYKSLGTG